MDEHRLRGASGGCEGANLKTINQSKSWYCHPIQNYRNDQTEKIQHQHIFSKQEVDESHAWHVSVKSPTFSSKTNTKAHG